MNYKSVGTVTFPESKNIAINMMPFIMGDFDSIPEEYRHYKPLIESCNINENQLGKVGYLSITESDMTPGKSHRRGGLHIEKQPTASWGGTGWGGSKPDGGLYIASTVDNSCLIYDYAISMPGEGGNCENWRYTLDKFATKKLMKANELIWLTDECPHESLPLFENNHRQWFRVVTSEVGIWFKNKSTENRLGIKPACVTV